MNVSFNIDSDDYTADEFLGRRHPRVFDSGAFADWVSENLEEQDELLASDHVAPAGFALGSFHGDY